MIKVGRVSEHEGICSVDFGTPEEFRGEVRALMMAILSDSEATLIFLEEFNDIAKELEKRLKDDQNSISDKSNEQSDKRN